MSKNNQLNEQEINLAFVDVEATGLSINHEIIEIGVILVSQPNFEIIEEWERKIKPKRIKDADPEALDLIGYTEKEWENAVELKLALAEFLEKVNDAIIIGHNISWDLMWLRKALFENGFGEKFARRSFDSFTIAYVKLLDKVPEIKYFSLSNLARYFGINEPQKHRALADCRTAYEVFKKLMEIK